MKHWSTQTLKSKDRYRIYCCLAECPVCKSPRGVRCVHNGKEILSSGHFQRGQAVQDARRHSRLHDPRQTFERQYKELLRQALMQDFLDGPGGYIPGHE